MKVARITSQILELRDSTSIEGGVYEIDVHIEKDEFDAAASPKDLLFKTIALNLAGCIHHTKIPADYWEVQFTPFIQRTFNLPAALKMGL